MHLNFTLSNLACNFTNTGLYAMDAFVGMTSAGCVNNCADNLYDNCSKNFLVYTAIWRNNIATTTLCDSKTERRQKFDLNLQRETYFFDW